MISQNVVNKISMRKIMREAIRESEGWEEPLEASWEASLESSYKNLNKYITSLNKITTILEKKYKNENSKKIEIPEGEQEKVKNFVKLLYENFKFKQAISIVKGNRGLLSRELKTYVDEILEALEQHANEDYYNKMVDYNDNNIQKVESGQYGQYLRDIIEESIFATLDEKHDKLYCVYASCYTSSVKRVLNKWNVLVGVTMYLQNIQRYNKDTFEKIKFEYVLADIIEETSLINNIEASGLMDSWMESDYTYIRREFEECYNKIELEADEDILRFIEHIGYMTIGLGGLHSLMQEILIVLLKINMKAYETFIAEVMTIKEFGEEALEEYIKVAIQQ